jgi:predicted dienelactone hydrolase
MRSLGTLVATAALVLAGATTAGAASYDPLRLPAVEAPAPVDLEVHDKDRDRDIPLRVYLPALGGPAPVVLFSHGLGGSREGSSFLGRHWAARGYVAVFLQHPGSDRSVWEGQGREQGMRELRKAANVKNFKLRAEDVTAVLDQLERWNDRPGSVLRGRMDLSRIGMSGHSFGAITTQAVSGQSYASGGQRFTDKRIDAAILFSPSSPRRGTPGRAFADVKLPWLLMTGTEDQAPIGDTVEGRLAVYPALPPGGKYELVLDGAKHSAFTDRPLPNDSGERNPNHHRAILAISTAFWDAYIKGDAQARAWLDGEAVRQVLEPADRWQHK